MAFRHWVETVGLLFEAQKITDYLKANNGREFRDYVAKIPSVKEFMNKVVVANIVPFRPGKTGLWVRGSNFYPVKVNKETESTVTLGRTDNKTWEEIRHLSPIFVDPDTMEEIVVPKNRVDLTSDREYLKYLNWLTYIAMQADGDVSDFLNHVLLRYKAPLEASIERRDSAMMTTDFDLKKLPEVDDNISVKNSRSNKPGGEGKAIITFPNGWKWLNLEKGYCDIEGNAAGHCGNAGAEPGETILSLRDQDNRIHMTVVLGKNGVTNEMKAPGNRKPKPYTHPYVVELLKNPLVKGVGPGKYMPENDFHLNDLGPNEWQALSETRPDITGASTLAKLASQSQGDQRKFRKLVEQEFGVPFPYSYDPSTRAVLVDHGDLQRIVTDWNIVNHSDDPLEPPSGERFSGRYFAQMVKDYFDELPSQLRSAISQAYKANAENIDQALLTAMENNAGLLSYFSQLQNNVLLNARIMEANQQNKGTDWFVQFSMKGNQIYAKVLVEPQAAEQLLRAKQPLKPSEKIASIDLDIEGSRDYGNILVSLTHALQQSRFWERPPVAKMDVENPGVGRSSPESIEARRAAYSLQIRNEMIHRELSKHMMNGTYDQYVQELKKKGWWDDYEKWASR